jgi:hypothetical protein
VARRLSVRITANFEHNLENVERFLTDNDSADSYDRLLAGLTESVIPNLQRFPDMGRPFLDRETGSIETRTAHEGLKAKLAKLAAGTTSAVREYVWSDHLILYARIGDVVYLLSIRHHRQLSFDFAGHWPP